MASRQSRKVKFFGFWTKRECVTSEFRIYLQKSKNYTQNRFKDQTEQYLHELDSRKLF